MEVNIRRTEYEDNVDSNDSCGTQEARESCRKSEEEATQKDSIVLTTKRAYSTLSNDQSSSISPLGGHQVLWKTKRKRPWHNYKSAKCLTPCLSCRQSSEEEKRQALVRREHHKRKADSLMRLIDSVKRVRCTIRCSDVIKDIIRNEVAVKIERVKCQQKPNVKQKTTLVRKVSIRNSVKKIKRECRRRRELNVLQKPKIYDGLQQASIPPACNDDAPESAGCDSPPCDDDHWLSCMQCNTSYHGDCPIHGPAFHIATKDVLETVETTKARASLPDYLILNESSIPDAGTGVFANFEIPQGTRFGPYTGDILVDDVIDSGYQWEIIAQKRISHYIDAEDENSGSWLRFINCARTETEQNLIAIQYRSQIYYYSYKTIYPGQELLVWYGNQFAESLGLVDEDETKSARNENIRRICTKCCYVLSSGTDLSRHERYDCILRDKCQSCVQHLMDSYCLKSHAELLSRCGDTSKLTSFSPPKLACHVRDCSELFADWDSLEIHLRDDHKTEKNLCSLCSLKLPNVESFRNHMRIVHQEVDLWKCPDCNRSLVFSINFLRLVNKQGHKETKRGKVQMKIRDLQCCNLHQPLWQCLPYSFACFRCRRAFTHQLEAMDHVANRCKYKRQTTSFSTAVKFASVCYYLCDFPFCGAQYATPSRRTRHFRKVHLRNCKLKKCSASDINRFYEKRPNVCNICDAEIFNWNLFFMHMKMVHGIWNKQSYPKCQIQNKKKKYNARKRVKEHSCRSYYAPQTLDGNAMDNLVGIRNDYVTSEKNNIADVSNQSLVGELQDMRVSSSETYLKDKIVKPFTGITEFCLHGKIPTDDIDCELTSCLSEGSGVPGDCNSLDCTGNLVIDESESHISPSHFPSAKGKDDRLEVNIFNKLFSDLLKDGFQLDASADQLQPMKDLSNSLSTSKPSKSLNYSEICPPVVASGDIFDDKGFEEQQPSDVLTSEPALHISKHAKAAQDGTDIVLNSNLKQDFVFNDREPHSVAICSSTELLASPSFVTVSKTCAKNTELDQSDCFSLPDLDPVDIVSGSCSYKCSIASSPLSCIDDGTSALEKMLDCPAMALSSSHEVGKVGTDAKDICHGDLQNPADLCDIPMPNNCSSPLSVAKTSQLSSSNLQIADTSSDIALEDNLSSKEQLDGICSAGNSHTCVPHHDGNGLNMVDTDKVFECNQMLPAKSNNVGDFNNNATDNCDVWAKPRSEVNGSLANEDSGVTQDNSTACSQTKGDRAIESFAKISKNAYDNDSFITEHCQIKNSALADVSKDDDHRGNAIQHVCSHSIGGESIKEQKDSAALDQSKKISIEKEHTQILFQEGSYFQEEPLNQCKNGSNATVDNIGNNGDYNAPGDDASGNDDPSDNDDDNISPEFENEIILAIQRYMVKNNVTVNAQHGADGKLSNMKDARFDESEVSVQNTMQSQSSLSAKGPLLENVSSCKENLTKDFCHKKLHFEQLDLNDRTIFKSSSKSSDVEVSRDIMYKDWMTEKPRGNTVINLKQTELASGFFTRDCTESRVVTTDNETSAVDRPKRYLNKDVSGLSSDQIRLQLRHQNSNDRSADKVDEILSQKPDFVRKNNTTVNSCPAGVLSNPTSALFLSTVSDLDGQSMVKADSQGIKATPHNTLIQSGVIDSSGSLVNSHGKRNARYRDFSAGHMKKGSPHQFEIKSSAPVVCHEGRDITQYKSLLKDCGGSSPVRDTLPSSSTFRKERPFAIVNAERRKVRRKSVTLNIFPQPSFEFHKLSELSPKKKREDLKGGRKLLDATVADGSRELNLDSGLCGEKRHDVVPSNTSFSKRNDSLEGRDNDAVLCERKNCKSSKDADNKRKNIGLRANNKNGVKKRRTSAVSYFKVSDGIQSITEVIDNKVASSPDPEAFVTSNSNVHTAEAPQLVTDSAHHNATARPRFMRSKSCDLNLEEKIEQSLLSAEKLVVKLPMKYRVLGSNALTTICSKTCSNILELELSQDITSSTGRGLTFSDSDSATSDAEMEELDRKISEKRDEISYLMREIRDVKARIRMKSQNSLNLSRQLSKSRKRGRLKRRSFIAIDDNALLKRRYIDISDNVARKLDTVVKNCKVYHKINKFERKRLVVHLEMIKSLEGSEKLVSRPWHCNDFSMNFETRPCAVSLSRC